MRSRSRRRGGRLDKSRGSAEKREAEAKFARMLHELMTDEALQNAEYQTQLQELMAPGGAVDEVGGATGEFGRDPGNPVPVNGPLGEMVYISNLRLPAGICMIGHRLGSSRRIDVYELVALDGSRWDLLFFDPYHTRKSHKLPAGYVSSARPQLFLLATNHAVETFPDGFAEAMSHCTERVTGVPLVAPQLYDETLLRGISRPESHLSALRALRLEARADREGGPPPES